MAFGLLHLPLLLPWLPHPSLPSRPFSFAVPLHLGTLWRSSLGLLSYTYPNQPTHSPWITWINFVISNAIYSRGTLKRKYPAGICLWNLGLIYLTFYLSFSWMANGHFKFNAAYSEFLIYRNPISPLLYCPYHSIWDHPVLQFWHNSGLVSCISLSLMPKILSTLVYFWNIIQIISLFLISMATNLFYPELAWPPAYTLVSLQSIFYSIAKVFF